MSADAAADPPDAGRPQPGEVGALLVDARESAGLSLDDVASRTRIRASLIRRMEAGDFAPAGGAVYARGHLRSIARVLGADDKAWVYAYDRMAGAPASSAATVVAEPAGEPPAPVPFASLARPTRPPEPRTVLVTGQQDVPPSAGPVRTTSTPSTPSTPSTTSTASTAVTASAAGTVGPGEPRRARTAGPSIVLPGPGPGRDRRSPLLLAAIGVVALLIVVAVVVLVRPHHSGTSHVAAPHRPTPSAGAPPASDPVTAPTAPSAPQPLADAGVNVVVAVSSSASWVHVVDATGTLVYQGIFTPGTTRTFHSAQQLKFVFGYAPAVRLTVNGHAVGSPPATGSSDVADAVFNAQSGA